MVGMTSESKILKLVLYELEKLDTIELKEKAPICWMKLQQIKKNLDTKKVSRKEEVLKPNVLAHSEMPKIFLIATGKKIQEFDYEFDECVEITQAVEEKIIEKATAKYFKKVWNMFTKFEKERSIESKRDIIKIVFEELKKLEDSK